MFEDILGTSSPPILHDNIAEVIADALNNANVTTDNMPTAINVIEKYMDRTYGGEWKKWYYIKITYNSDNDEYEVEVIDA